MQQNDDAPLLKRVHKQYRTLRNRMNRRCYAMCVLAVMIFLMFAVLVLFHLMLNSRNKQMDCSCDSQMQFITKEDLVGLVQDIPDVKKKALNHVFEDLELKQDPNTMWLEFGVNRGGTINYIAGFTEGEVHGFDSFVGLPEDWRPGFAKGRFSQNEILPKVKDNVHLHKGWFNETLPPFIASQGKKVSFLHLDGDLYSSTKIVLDELKDFFATDCVVVFDELSILNALCFFFTNLQSLVIMLILHRLVNYSTFDGNNGELRAWYEFITRYDVEYTWIGMLGKVGDRGQPHESVAVMLHSVKDKKCS